MGVVWGFLRGNAGVAEGALLGTTRRGRHGNAGKATAASSVWRVLNGPGMETQARHVGSSKGMAPFGAARPGRRGRFRRRGLGPALRGAACHCMADEVRKFPAPSVYAVHGAAGLECRGFASLGLVFTGSAGEVSLVSVRPTSRVLAAQAPTGTSPLRSSRLGRLGMSSRVMSKRDRARHGRPGMVVPGMFCHGTALQASPGVVRRSTARHAMSEHGRHGIDGNAGTGSSSTGTAGEVCSGLDGFPFQRAESMARQAWIIWLIEARRRIAGQAARGPSVPTRKIPTPHGPASHGRLAADRRVPARQRPALHGAAGIARPGPHATSGHDSADRQSARQARLGSAVRRTASPGRQRRSSTGWRPTARHGRLRADRLGTASHRISRKGRSRQAWDVSARHCAARPGRAGCQRRGVSRLSPPRHFTERQAWRAGARHCPARQRWQAAHVQARSGITTSGTSWQASLGFAWLGSSRRSDAGASCQRAACQCSALHRWASIGSAGPSVLGVSGHRSGGTEQRGRLGVVGRARLGVSRRNRARLIMAGVGNHRSVGCSRLGPAGGSSVGASRHGPARIIMASQAGLSDSASGSDRHRRLGRLVSAARGTSRRVSDSPAGVASWAARGMAWHGVAGSGRQGGDCRHAAITGKPRPRRRGWERRGALFGAARIWARLVATWPAGSTRTVRIASATLGITGQAWQLAAWNRPARPLSAQLLSARQARPGSSPQGRRGMPRLRAAGKLGRFTAPLGQAGRVAEASTALASASSHEGTGA